MRTLCVWCPDWPVTTLRLAGRVPAEGPVVVMGEGGQVHTASAEARAEGVRRGFRKRDAQARCPQAVVIDADPAAEARAFEEVARALEAVTARLAIHRPGLLSFPTLGQVRYFGSEIDVAQRAWEAVGSPLDPRVGVAGGGLAAFLVARRATPVLILDDDETARFLASRPVTVLHEHGLGEFAGLLRRLGLRTLGDLAALPEGSVVARFGSDGARAHRLARGLDEDPPALTAPPPELAEAGEFDPPALQAEEAVLVGRSLAERLLSRLARHGLAASRVTVEAETEYGERLVRTWRFGGGTAGEAERALAQRVRWQLDAWLSAVDGPRSGLTLLRLVPEEVVPARGHQLDFWGADGRATERATRALIRLQGLLGHAAVVQPVLRGGRTPAEQTGWAPFGDHLPPRSWVLCNGDRATKNPRTRGQSQEQPSWPGAVPAPSPALVYDPALPATFVDASGEPVRISGRGEMPLPPARLRCAGLVDAPVEGWAGPWPHDVRFWDRQARRRRALFQVVAGGVACLVSVEAGQATVEALYD
ncbi:MAG: DNA polymerase Y family protein [Actinobacteria bacterium]|nr:DNA polymerase Y family protein [Actinomycetota bacterium]